MARDNRPAMPANLSQIAAVSVLDEVEENTPDTSNIAGAGVLPFKLAREAAKALPKGTYRCVIRGVKGGFNNDGDHKLVITFHTADERVNPKHTLWMHPDMYQARKVLKTLGMSDEEIDGLRTGEDGLIDVAPILPYAENVVVKCVVTTYTAKKGQNVGQEQNSVNDVLSIKSQERVAATG